MSDLVSRKALEKAIRDYADDIGCKRGEKELANGVLMSLSKVRNAPIAYDVDKVAIEISDYFQSYIKNCNLTEEEALTMLYMEEHITKLTKGAVKDE